MDIVPFDSMLTPEEIEKRDRGDKKIRNKLANEALKKALKFKPPQPAFYSKHDAERITTGNFDDDLEKIKDCDLVIEAVVERLDIKRSLFEKVDKYRGENTIIATNTSGLSIVSMAEGRSEGFKKHFLGMHFFNPVRFMKLLEIIPHPETDPEILDFIEEFATDKLGKGVIRAKDTPNFIANRIGIHSMFLTVKLMQEMDYRIDEVDAIAGKAMGNAKSAVFKTADLVGLDTLKHVALTIYENCPDDEERELFKPPKFLDEMIERGWLGRKAVSGFYKRGPNKEKLVIDWKTLEYIPQEKFSYPSLDAAKEISDPRKRLKKLVYADDRAGKFAWKVLAGGLIYAANRIPEIADKISDIDNAMKWGFNRELGPFEAWDAIGLKESVEKMKGEGYKIPANIEKMLELGHEKFYTEIDGKPYEYDLVNHEYIPIKEDSRILIIKKLPEKSKVAENDSATLWHIGDGVLLYDIHTPQANVIDNETIEMQNKALDLLEAGKYEAMVLGNNDPNFCVGANLMMVLMAINSEEFDQLRKTVRDFQEANMRMKYCKKPIVAAPIGYTFGGGCELIMHSHKVVGAAESYIGLVEVGVGLIPAGGGTKEMVLRAVEHISPDALPYTPLLPFARRAFEAIAKADVATSFKQAIDIGYLRPSDKMVVNADYRLTEAKKVALAMAEEGFDPGEPKKNIPVVGVNGRAAFIMAAKAMRDAGWATDYDVFIDEKLAYIIGGGERAEGQFISEWELLDMELEVFMELAHQEKTKERIIYMLQNKKPLRN